MNIFMSWDDNAFEYNFEQGDLKSDYGPIHMYALFMTIGVIATLLISVIKMHRKKIPLNGLFIAAVPIVILALFGASFFGKMPQNEGSFWSWFEFWQGGMSIHGAVLVGTIVGIFIFYFIGRTTNVSLLVYADAILPNVLIGQCIGRWGNFFNHELFGPPVSLASDVGKTGWGWLPDFILKNTQRTYTGNYDVLNGVSLINGEKYQMMPIFLIESFSLFLGWALITFVIPGIGRWISKKPWKLFSDEYKIDIKQSFLIPFSKDKSDIGYSYWKVWDLAFYSNYDINALKNYKKNLNDLSENFLSKEKRNLFTFINYRYQAGKLLVRANNPNNYKIPFSGIEAGLYFFIWNLVRFSLEYIRPVDNLFISHHRTLSLVLVGGASLLGLIFVFLSIWVFPFLFRKQDYTFEKYYINITDKGKTIEPISYNNFVTKKYIKIPTFTKLTNNLKHKFLDKKDKKDNNNKEDKN